jgi:hypothetical protein
VAQGVHPEFKSQYHKRKKEQTYVGGWMSASTHLLRAYSMQTPVENNRWTGKESRRAAVLSWMVGQATADSPKPQVLIAYAANVPGKVKPVPIHEHSSSLSWPLLKNTNCHTLQ